MWHHLYVGVMMHFRSQDTWWSLIHNLVSVSRKEFFNYWILQMRCIIENAFGIFTNQGVFFLPHTVVCITPAAVVPQNKKLTRSLRGAMCPHFPVRMSRVRHVGSQITWSQSTRNTIEKSRLGPLKPLSLDNYLDDFHFSFIYDQGEVGD